MKSFKINNRTYIAKPFDFNLVCDLEDVGIDVMQGKFSNTSLLRAYFAICSGFDKETAGAEIQAHVMNGGTLTELNEVIGHEIENSDFFRKLNETAEQKATESAEEATAEETEAVETKKVTKGKTTKA